MDDAFLAQLRCPLDPEREATLSFSAPYADVPVHIYVHKDISGIRDLASLKGFVVGVKDGDACIERLTEAGVTRLMRLPSYLALVDAAKASTVRMFCMDGPPAEFLLYRAGLHRDYRAVLTLNSGQLHHAVRKADLATLARVDRGFATFTDEDREALRRQWLSPGERVPPAWEHYVGLIALGGVALLSGSLWAAAAVAFVMFVVVLSYRQNVHAYPSGGGDYEVATVNLGATAGTTVASALLVDYVLTVAVSISSGAQYAAAAIPVLEGHEATFAIVLVVILMAINLRGDEGRAVLYRLAARADGMDEGACDDFEGDDREARQQILRQQPHDRGERQGGCGLEA